VNWRFLFLGIWILIFLYLKDYYYLWSVKLKTSTYNHPFTLTTEWAYDSWNRVKQIIYPDNEKVTYSYNFGGLLKHVEGYKPNIGTTVYIEDITYDEYEQRTAVINGNQTRTYYTYDPVMRRMTNLKTVNQNGNLLKLAYTYDSVGNITNIKNTGINPYTQTYTYDDVYQLDSAYGNWTDNYTPITYNLNMTYSPAGRIIGKSLSGLRIDNTSTYSLNYNNTYSYNFTNNPYAVNRITNSLNGKIESFSWDVKGNMIRHRSDLNSWKERFLCWTEDNRLQAVKDNKMGAYYNYDAAGERNLKLTGGIINVTQNGQSVYAPVFDQQTLYASALVTVNDKGYTKHYFEEGKRICSKIGSGELKNVFDPVPKIEKSYEEQRDIQVEGINTTYSQCMDISPYIKNGNLYENIINKYTTQVNSSEPAFYYHSDHLGSASYITDSSGIQTQQLVYLPFGEDWVDKKYNVSQFQTPYKFNGKEKDQETGYNNYGARYYTDWASIWLSVDPLSDKYPHLTSYNYCANNPIMLIDPDGRETTDYGLKKTGEIVRLTKKDDKPDNLYVLNDNGTKDRTINPLTVNDKNLLPSLSSENAPNFEEKVYPFIKHISQKYIRNEGMKTTVTYEKIKGRYAKTRSGTDAKNLFTFVASHSYNEWGISGYKNGDWLVGTLYQDAQAPSFDGLGKNYHLNNQIYRAHSHGGIGETYFKPSVEDLTRARGLPNTKSYLFMPKNPKTKWIQLK
jgi:RHS repeat-associated protein